MNNPPSDLPLDSTSPLKEALSLSPPAPASNVSSINHETQISELQLLLRELESLTVPSAVLPSLPGTHRDNELAVVRLGLASSLFVALQCKHAATAGHSLRVASIVSAWAMQMGLTPEQRDEVEVAALLHDVGMIGVPDHILLKPAILNANERIIIDKARKFSVEILRHCCANPAVLAIVEDIPVWYDGSRFEYPKRGEEIVLGARMISIAEAFDAMVTDRVFRPARSQERAMAGLFEYAGTQFDPTLVPKFAVFTSRDQIAYQEEIQSRWLNSLDPEMVNSYWALNNAPSPPRSSSFSNLFELKLLENMYDAVAFVDTAGCVVHWNRGAERLTGMPSTSIRGNLWHPDLLQMADERGEPLAENDCPVHHALQDDFQSLRRLSIRDRMGRQVTVDTHAIPVTAVDGVRHGAVLLLHDASSETSLEKRCLSLYEKSTHDPMTQVANRAEFDRVHTMFVEAHQQQNIPCSLIICDLDRFKSVNDTFGHQAGDDVIKSLASLLKSGCRAGDLVARYGGEEFVILCADCNNATAARRAEHVRIALNQIPQPRMEGRTVSCSFGVTEIQPGDTPETMLRRADRALLQAKEKGRNCVVQLGMGSTEGENSAETTPKKSSEEEDLVQKTLVTPVPFKMAVEKLRGFVADHQAKILTIDRNHIVMEIANEQSSWLRRLSDRPVVFLMDLIFEEEKTADKKGTHRTVQRTRIHARIRPNKVRNRRREELQRQAMQVLVSFRSYLMATEVNAADAEPFLHRIKHLLGTWSHK